MLDVMLEQGGATVIDLCSYILIKVNEHRNIYPFNLHTFTAENIGYSLLSDEYFEKYLGEIQKVYSASSESRGSWMCWHQQLSHLNTGAVCDLAQIYAARLKRSRYLRLVHLEIESNGRP
jgi:hypothetical protein